MLFGKHVSRMGKRVQASLGEGMAFAEERLSQITTVRVYGREGYELGEFERRSQEQLGEHAPGHQWRSLRRETSESDGSSDDGDAPPVAGVASPTVPSTPGVLAEG